MRGIIIWYKPEILQRKYANTQKNDRDAIHRMNDNESAMREAQINIRKNKFDGQI